MRCCLATFLLLPLAASGCIGFINGYLAESPQRLAGTSKWEQMTPEERDEARELMRMRNGPFPAVSMDFAVLDDLLEYSSNPLLDAYAIVLIGVDLPFSAVFDTLFLPVKLTAYAIHGYPLPSSLPPEPATQPAEDSGAPGEPTSQPASSMPS